TWLKDYNKQAIRKVHVLGIDNNAFAPSFALMDYYSEVLGSKIAEPYLYAVYTGDLPTTLSLSKSDSLLRQALGEDNFNYLLYCLSEKFSKDLAGFIDCRDSAMFRRTTFVDTLLVKSKEKIVILAHSRHLQKIPILR